MKITISGIGGVGKGTVSKLLSEKLNYKILSGGDFFRKMADEKDMTVYEFDQFVKENLEYDKKLDEMQKKYGEENDNFILESRLGWFFVKDSVKIQLTCDEPERLRRVCEREGCNIFEAKNDEQIRLDSIHERYKELYGIENFEDKENYDLIIDTTELKPEEIVNLIMEKIEK